MKHTPGPWYPVNYAGYINLQTTDYYDPDVDVLDVNDFPDQAEANGKLAAAAPELLEALQAIQGIEVWITDPEMKKLFQSKVYPAIKKATQ